MKHIKKFEHLSSQDIQDILNRWRISTTFDKILKHWSESHRHYHTTKHLNDLITKTIALLNKGTISKVEFDKLIIIALFHDIVYDPMSNTNEEDSAKMFMDSIAMNTVPENIKTDLLEIEQAILDTKSHKPTSWISRIFCNMDMSVLDGSFDDLMIWEDGIWNEFKAVGKDRYKTGRLSFLNKMVSNKHQNSDNLSKLISWVETNY